MAVTAASFAVSWAATFEMRRLPRRTEPRPELYQEPKQVPAVREPFKLERKGEQYEIQPVADYELYGLVVSSHNAKSFWDISHAMWDDHLNTKDVCVVWGKNLELNLASFKFWSGDFTCYYMSKDPKSFSVFNHHQISNNHLLPSGPIVAKAIANAEIGDQIRMKGQLANYSINGGPFRKTSTVRTDTEGGACETVFINEFEILARENGFWIYLSRSAWMLFLISGGLLLAGVLRIVLRHEQRVSAGEDTTRPSNPVASE